MTLVKASPRRSSPEDHPTPAPSAMSLPQNPRQQSALYFISLSSNNQSWARIVFEPYWGSIWNVRRLGILEPDSLILLTRLLYALGLN